MAILPSYPLPTPTVTLNSVADPELVTALQGVLTGFNGNIDYANLSGALQSQVNSGTVGSRGATNITTSQSTSSTSYVTLATPDQVAGIVLLNPGLIEVSFFASWQDSVSLGGSAAIFIGSNQLKIASSASAAPVVQECAVANRGIDNTAVNYTLFTTTYGLESFGTTAYSGDVTTGQVVGAYSNFGGSIPPGLGGAVRIFAAAGTYTVSVRFKASSGSVTASNRRLYVQALGFS